MIFFWNFGMNYCPKPKSQPTCYANPTPPLPFLHMPILMVLLTTTRCLWLPWAAMFKSTKSDSHCTWAFQSIHSWYLNKYPTHYQTHKCHIKHTNSECFSNTIKFRHKGITSPSISLADKIMRTILSWIHTICGLPDFRSNSNLQQLHSILHDATITQQHCNMII